MIVRGKSRDCLRQGRRTRLLREMVNDPCETKRKLPEPTVCPECGSAFMVCSLPGRILIWRRRSVRPLITPRKGIWTTTILTRRTFSACVGCVKAS